MKKKIYVVLLIAIVIIISCINNAVNATLKCNLEMQTVKTEYEKKEKFNVDIKLSNIKTENGIVAFLGTLKYDKKNLKLVEMEGQGGWLTPDENGYNEQNGKILMEGMPIKKDSKILTLTFEVLENSKKDLTVSIENVQIANGVDNYLKLDNVEKKLTLKEITNNEDEDKSDDNNNVNEDEKTNDDSGKPSDDNNAEEKPDNNDSVDENIDNEEDENINENLEDDKNDDKDKNNLGTVNNNENKDNSDEKDSKLPVTSNKEKNPNKLSGLLPKTGKDVAIDIFVILGIILVAIAIINYKKINKINKKYKK